MSGAILLLPLHAFMLWTGTNVPSTFFYLRSLPNLPGYQNSRSYTNLKNSSDSLRNIAVL
jgi:hypothetical protein